MNFIVSSWQFLKQHFNVSILCLHLKCRFHVSVYWVCWREREILFMSDCHLWICSPGSYKLQIFPSIEIKYMLEQKKFRVTEQTLATLKLCNNIETAECRQTHWELIFLQTHINLCSVCFRSHCFQVFFSQPVEKPGKKTGWNANRSNLLLSFRG